MLRGAPTGACGFILNILSIRCQIAFAFRIKTQNSKLKTQNSKMSSYTKNIYLEIAGLINKNTPAALAVIVSAKGSTPRHIGAKMLVFADGGIIGTIGGAILEKMVIDAAKEILRSGLAKKLTFQLHEHESPPEKIPTGMLCGGEVEVFIEPIAIQPIVHIIGAGHVAKPTAELAAKCGFRTFIYDARPEMASKERFPAADKLLVGEIAALLKDIEITANDFIVIVSPDHPTDFTALTHLLKKDCRYLGVICSKKKWKTFRRELSDLGFAAEQIDRVHAPIGLDIASETPEEIAVSIVAELIKVRNLEKSH